MLKRPYAVPTKLFRRSIFSPTSTVSFFITTTGTRTSSASRLYSIRYCAHEERRKKFSRHDQSIPCGGLFLGSNRETLGNKYIHPDNFGAFLRHRATFRYTSSKH